MVVECKSYTEKVQDLVEYNLLQIIKGRPAHIKLTDGISWEYMLELMLEYYKDKQEYERCFIIKDTIRKAYRSY